ncbi:MAG: iron-containing alcohol dehydrogenase [Chitinivibrionales bacterium]|nr:iron-containing alcohol dehydrogenase [Chitinivibrionales bacterium]
MTHEIYGDTIRCECGKTHHIDPGIVIYEPGALCKLPEILQHFTKRKKAAVIVDARTRAVAGQQATKQLLTHEWSTREIVVPDPEPGMDPKCDEETHAYVKSRVGDASIIVAAGCGVLNDLSKWAAFELDLPYVCVATAASMNGYASANIAATVKGVKIVKRGRAPRAVLADPAIIMNAPNELTASGLGDILAKSVSAADWVVNHLLYGDYYCERANLLIADIEPLYLDNPEGIRDRSPQAFEALFQGLLLTGVAMTMAETSSPSSGGEHLISHTLDMMSGIDGIPHYYHGSQVGIGTIIASELYYRIMHMAAPKLKMYATDINPQFWGWLTDEVTAHFNEKQVRLHAMQAKLSAPENWSTMQSRVKEFVRHPEVIRDCLKRAGAAYTAEHICCSRERLITALLHAHEVRSRVTILDLARMTGILPDAAGEIVGKWC